MLHTDDDDGDGGDATANDDDEQLCVLALNIYQLGKVRIRINCSLTSSQ